MAQPIGILCNAIYQRCSSMINRENQAPSTFNPHNTIVVFDIHGVLFKHDYMAMFKAMMRSGYPWQFARHLCKPTFLKDLFKLMHKGSVAEEYLVGLVSRYPDLKDYVPLGINTANLQIPNKSILQLVHELKSHGYELHILSNIGGEIFEDLRSKYPAIFENFTAIKVACAQEQYLSKPKVSAYVAYLKEFNSNDKQIIFIDDKAKNIRMARRLGMTSIFFCCPHHVKERMKNLGVVQ